MALRGTIKYAALCSAAILALLAPPAFAYEAGQLKNHGHTSAAGDGGTLSNLTVTGFVKIAAGGTGFVNPDGSTTTTSGVVVGSSPTWTGTHTFSGTVAPTFSTGTTFGSMADPAAPAVGQLWYNSTLNRLRYNANGSTVELDPSFYVVNLLASPNVTGGASTQFFQNAENCVAVSSGTGIFCGNSTEAAVSTALGIATLQRFSCAFTSSGGDPNTFTFTIDKNEAATTMTCNFTGPSANGVSSCATNTNPVTLASNDRISLKLVTSGGNTALADSLRCVFVYSMGTQ